MDARMFMARGGVSRTGTTDESGGLPGCRACDLFVRAISHPGQIDAERRSDVRLALHPHEPTPLGHDRLNEREPEARGLSRSLRRIERLEHARQYLRRHPDSRVPAPGSGANFATSCSSATCVESGTRASGSPRSIS